MPKATGPPSYTAAFKFSRSCGVGFNTSKYWPTPEGLKSSSSIVWGNVPTHSPGHGGAGPDWSKCSEPGPKAKYGLHAVEGMPGFSSMYLYTKYSQPPMQPSLPLEAQEAAKPRDSDASSPSKCKDALTVLMQRRLSSGANAPKTQQLPQWPWLWIRPITSAQAGHLSRASKFVGKDVAAFFGILLSRFFSSACFLTSLSKGARPRRRRKSCTDSCTIQSRICDRKPKFAPLRDLTSDSVTTGFWDSIAALALSMNCEAGSEMSRSCSSLTESRIAAANRDRNAASSSSVSSLSSPAACATWSKTWSAKLVLVLLVLSILARLGM
mmetsp:Transcript_57703/g.175737  ORF Transcript_57703/g.175737 Transcript_57703/m.175737 type:complete len:325 (-) Transcript_57703:199-1173(-)